MKQIPIKNVKLLARLDNFATQLLKMPHTFRALPQPDLTFKKLKEHMAVLKKKDVTIYVSSMSCQNRGITKLEKFYLKLY